MVRRLTQSPEPWESSLFACLDYAVGVKKKSQGVPVFERQKNGTPTLSLPFAFSPPYVKCL